MRGRARGDGRKLSQVQEDTLQRMIIGKRPEQLNIDFPLWSRAALGQLIEQALGYPTASTQHRQLPHPQARRTDRVEAIRPQLFGIGQPSAVAGAVKQVSGKVKALHGVQQG